MEAKTKRIMNANSDSGRSERLFAGRPADADFRNQKPYRKACANTKETDLFLYLGAKKVQQKLWAHASGVLKTYAAQLELFADDMDLS
jgi:uncharacterized protein HemY